MRDRFFGACATLLLIMCFYAGAAALAVRATLQPAHVKSALANSGVYDEITPAVLRSGAIKPDASVAGISFGDPAVQEAAKQAFSGDYLRTQVEPGITDTLAWLNGDKPQPTFTIDLQQGRQRLGESLGSLVADKADGLSTCSPYQLLTIAGRLAETLQSGEGLAALPCRPPGVTRGLIERTVARYVESGNYAQGPASQARVQASDITFQGAPFYQNAGLKRASQGLRIIKWLPWVSGLLVVILLIGAAKLLGREQALLVFAKALLVSAVLLILTAIIAPSPIKAGLTHIQDSRAYSVVFQKIEQSGVALTSDASRYLQYAAVPMTVIGLWLVLGLRKTTPYAE